MFIDSHVTELSTRGSIVLDRTILLRSSFSVGFFPPGAQRHLSRTVMMVGYRLEAPDDGRNVKGY